MKNTEEYMISNKSTEIIQKKTNAMEKITPCTKYIVALAMKIVSKDVRKPKCVRDGSVKT